MRAVILGPTGWHSDELRQALTARGHAVHTATYEELVASLGGEGTGDRLSSAGTSLLDADVVLPRLIPRGSLDQIIFRVNALHWLETHGVTVVNTPGAIERTVDKFYASALLRACGLDVPDTTVCERLDDAQRAVERMGDAIIKPLFGSMGRGMVRVSDPDTAYRVLRALDDVRTVFYVQRVIEPAGRDVRVFVVGGRVRAAIERTAPDGDWRANVARGAVARALELPPAWEAVALRAAAAVGTDYAGVDLMPAPDGRVFVLEVNGIPGWQGLQAATGLRVAQVIAEHIEARVSAVRRASTVAP
jgi:RimK family alpha-L-glutamate ligase